MTRLRKVLTILSILTVLGVTGVAGAVLADTEDSTSTTVTLNEPYASYPGVTTLAEAQTRYTEFLASANSIFRNCTHYNDADAAYTARNDDRDWVDPDDLEWGHAVQPRYYTAPNGDRIDKQHPYGESNYRTSWANHRRLVLGSPANIWRYVRNVSSVPVMIVERASVQQRRAWTYNQFA